MKSMKTLIISAAVCGAMALPLSGAAAPTPAPGQGNVVTALQTLYDKLGCGGPDASTYCGAVLEIAKESGIEPPPNSRAV